MTNKKRRQTKYQRAGHIFKKTIVSAMSCWIVTTPAGKELFLLPAYHNGPIEKVEGKSTEQSIWLLTFLKNNINKFHIRPIQAGIMFIMSFRSMENRNTIRFKIKSLDINLKFLKTLPEEKRKAWVIRLLESKIAKVLVERI